MGAVDTVLNVAENIGTRLNLLQPYPDLRNVDLSGKVGHTTTFGWDCAGGHGHMLSRKQATHARGPVPRSIGSMHAIPRLLLSAHNSTIRAPLTATGGYCDRRQRRHWAGHCRAAGGAGSACGAGLPL